MARISAFNADRIVPDVGKGRIREAPGLHVLNDRVGQLADPLHLARAHAVHLEGRGEPYPARGVAMLAPLPRALV